ncbi:MAG: hypothetical protein WD534_02500 [Phycisphaeraceae bacterium]
MKYGLTGWMCAAALIVTPVVATAEERVRIDDQDRIVPVPMPVDERLNNPWPDDEVEALRDRIDYAIRAHGGKISGNTYFENEKAYYPTAFLAFLNGDRERALSVLQEQDNQAGSWNKHTEGIDLFPSFTLKGQVRKYFYFGEYLEDDYRERMRRAIGIWSEQDPYRRSHHAYDSANAGQGWTPTAHSSWVDIRATDNLRAMRETSAYLFAREAGNDEVAEAYRRRIERYVWALWNVGMGEWDSENYHFHTVAPYLNLYDFAPDEETRTLAKAALDMLFTRAAVRYYNGGWTGPIKRDYQKPYAFAAAAGDAWLWFADTAADNPHIHYDYGHFTTTAYRPPMAVVALARKQFDEPVELFASHPPYETWNAEGTSSAGSDYPSDNYPEADHEPAFHETTFIGHTYQFGTLARGSHGDTNGFKLLMRDSDKAAQFFVAASGGNLAGVNRGSGNDRIAHYRNVAIVLTPDGGADWSFVLPAEAGFEQRSGVTFIRGEQTWIALTPINLTISEPDGKQPKGNWTDTQGLAAKGTGGSHSGFVIEIGEAPTHGDFDAFVSNVLDRSEMTDEGDGQFTYTGVNGSTVGIHETGETRPVVYRNGERHDFANHWPLYQPADGGKAPVSLGWKEGRLYVEAGDHAFEAEFTDDGAYTWENRAAQ